jgi:hypothetical protein
MTSFEFAGNYSERVLAQSDQALHEAVAIVSPDNPNAYPQRSSLPQMSYVPTIPA